MLASVENGAKNRLATVFFYLNNVTTNPDVTTGGGQTNFPRAATAKYPNGGPLVRDYFDCSNGLSVYPQVQPAARQPGNPATIVAPCSLQPFTKRTTTLTSRSHSTFTPLHMQEGKVIIFYSMLPNGDMDDYSLHGGCDVLEKTATKWSANFWRWNKPYQFLDAARRRTTSELMGEWI